MRLRHSFWLFIIAIGVMVYAAPMSCLCAQTYKGTVLSVSGSGESIRLQTGETVTMMSPGAGAKIMRGQVGKDVVPVPLTDFAPGDHVVAVVDQNGKANSIKAFYGRVQGVFARLEQGKLVLDNERIVALSPEAQIVLADGKIGKASELAAGSMVVCRVNPVTNEAWTVVSAMPVNGGSNARPGGGTSESTTPIREQAKIKSLTYSLANPAKPGDLLTVDMSGTPGGKAVFEVKGLLESTAMKEISPGDYRAVAPIPKGRSIANAPLIARLKANGTDAPPVQASRLITVAGDTASEKHADAPAPTPAPKPPAPTPAQANKVAANTPPPPAPGKSEAIATLQPAKATGSASSDKKETAATASPKIVITDPESGSTIHRLILVKGKAEPDAKVQVTITYNNGKTGLLKLSGQVASQLVAVGKNGEFRMGPIALEGPLATKGLRFTIKAYYPDKDDHATATAVVVGDRY